MSFERLKFERLWTVKDETDQKGFRTYQDSEDQVRADLQYHPDAIKNFLDGLLDVLESAKAAGLIGVDADEEVLARTDGEGTVAAVLRDLYNEVARVEGMIDDILTSGTPDALRSAMVGFGENTWVAGQDGGYTMTLNVDSHKRRSATFGYQLWAEVDGVMRSNVWLAAGTDVAYQSDGTIVLTTEEPYAGRIAFFGV